MDIKTLAQIIQTNFIPSGKSVLSMPASGAQSLLSPDIGALITTYLGGTLTINNLEPQTPTVTQVTYKGTLSFLQQSFSVTAIFYLVNTSTDGTPELTVALALPSGWTFSQTYPPLKNQIIDQLVYAQPNFVLVSYTSDGSGTFQNLEQGLNFSGTLQSSDSAVLAPVNWLLGINLLLTGTLTNWSDPQNTAPTMQLGTPSQATSLTIGSVVLSTWIEADSAYTVSQGKPVLTTSVDLKGTVAIGSGTQKLLTLTMALQNDPDLLTFSLDANAALDSLGELTGLVGGSSLANLIPAQYPLSQILSLDELSIVVAPALRVIVNVTFGITLLKSSQTALGEVKLEPYRLGYFSPLVGPPRLLLQDESGSALLKDAAAPTSPTWVIVPNFVSISDIFLRFLLIDPLHPSLKNLYATIGATFWIGEKYPIAVQISLPDVTVSAYLLPGNTIPLADVMKHFGITPPEGFQLDVTWLQMTANPNFKTFDLGLALNGNVTLFSFNNGKFNLTLQQITVNLSLNQVGYTAQFAAYSNFAQTVDFVISAQKPAADSSGWIFSASITHPFSVGVLIENVTGWIPPQFIIDMSVTEFGLSYSTQDGTFSLNAGLQWLFKALNNLEIDLLFKLQSSNTNGTALYSGSTEGDFHFMGLTVTFIYAFDQVNKTNTYTLMVGPVTAVFANPNAQGDNVLQFNFGNTTLGDILVFLIRLADPAASSRLSSPWNVLNSINLANLSIIINFTKKYFEIDYSGKFDFWFITIDNIKLRYTRTYGEGQVQIQLQGTFLNQPFGKDNPLAWNSMNSQPPAIPGAGSKLIDLQYVGVGQHVSMNVRGLTSVTAIINALEKTVVPITNTSKNPLEQVGGLQFNSTSNWLVGTKFVILGSFALSVVFLDPEVYGLLIAVNCPKAGGFQGLSFEILYRKVTDTIGVYHIELKLPDVMRHLEFGEVSITLPIIVLDIYTNGNFRIDFGFPISLQNFSNSFAIEVFPFVGYGGFYFALLDGATSSRVPVIDNGNFSPVIEFGFALSVGVGKTLTIGPLSAGVSVTVIGMLQGAFAWFHPTEESTSSALYYWLQGTVAVVGQVYATVDFVVVKASASLTVYASITLTIEAYQPIIIFMQAGVEVRVSLKILFITLHFSFSATITLTFTIGSASTTPWHVAQQKQRSLQMRNQFGLHSPGPTMAARALLHARAGLVFPPPPKFSFAAVPSAPQDNVQLKLMLTPVISQALPSDFLPAAQGQPPLVACSLLLFVENAIPNTAVNARQASVPVADADQMPFNTLVQKLLTWAIQFIGKDSGDTVTATDLEHIHANLSDPSVIAQTFSYKNVTDFFKNYKVVFEIDLRPQTEPTDGNVSASFFPMFPELTLKVGASQIPFWSANPVDNDYVIALSTYFEQLMVDYENSVEQDPQQTGVTARQAKTLAVNGDSPTSMAGYLFCAYFAMLTRGVVQNAQDYLKSYTYTVTDQANTSLASIAAQFQPTQAEYIARRGDTLASIAVQLAMPLRSLLAGNRNLTAHATLQAGTRLAVEVSVTAESIVTANQSTTGLFTTGGVTATALQLTNVVYQTRTSDTFTTIAQGFSFPGSAPLDPMVIISGNSERAAILQTGTSFSLPTLQYTGRQGDTLDNVALYFGVPASQVTQSGMQFTISNVKHTIQGGFVINYSLKQGDTLDSIIQYFFGPVPSDQLQSYEQLLQNWNLKVDFANAPIGTLIQIPYSETLTNFARYYFPNVPAEQQLGTLAPSVVSQQILAPLATLTISAVAYVPQTQDTFSSIAQRFNFKLEELATQIEGQFNLFPNKTQLTVPNVPAIKVADLVTAIGSSKQTNSTAASTSRFLLQGLRLPYPQMTSSTYPLYSLTAQAFPVPTPLPAISLSIANSVKWITFACGGNSIALSFTADEQAQITAFQSLTFAPQISWLGRLPMFDYQPLHFTVQNPLHWQAAQAPPLACLSNAQAVTEPTLWALPGTLLNRIAGASGAELLYDLQVSTYLDATSGLQTNPVQCYAWATTVSLTVRQIPDAGSAGTSMPNTYLLVGADDVGKQTLFDVLAYLNSAAGKSDSAQLFLLYTPDPSTGNPQGVASDQLSTAQTFLLQTNLSTQSSSGAAMARTRRAEMLGQPPVAPRDSSGQIFSATIDQATVFLSLVWEASVVRTGGYYLQYTNSGQSGLPGYMFAQGTEASITLLILLGSQIKAGGAAMMPFNTAVVVGDNIDASRSNVHASPTTYQVQPADTLQTIANQFTGWGMSVAALALANQTIQNLLRPGQTLNINPTTPYTIQYGDTLATIAQSRQTTVTAIAAASSGLAMFTPGALMQFSGMQTYVVQLNDTLGGIVDKLKVPGLDVPALAQANQNNLALLQPKTVLNLTATTTYTIQPGDTLASIAMAHPPASVASIAVASKGLSILAQNALAFYGSQQLEMHATVPAGNTAFQLWRSYLAANANQQNLNLLFNLLGFSIAQNNYFNSSNEGLPAGPQTESGKQSTSAADDAGNDGILYYKQVLAFYKSAPQAQNPVPATPALPSPTGFPYAGIFAPLGAGQNAQIQLTLNFHDLSGNLTVPNAAPVLAPIPVGYTDDLTGLAQWHSVTAAFDFPSAQPQLQVTATFSMAKYLPGFGQSYASSHQSSLAHCEDYISLYYQMQEQGLSQFALNTSIGQIDSSLATRQQVQLSLLAFVSQAYLFLTAAKNLQQVYPPLAAGTQLGAVATTYATSVADIMSANKTVELVGQLFAKGAALNIPNYYLVNAGDTLSAILKQVNESQLEQNDQRPLNAGVAIIIPTQTYNVASQSQDSLVQIANARNTTVVNLAAQNPTVQLTTSSLTFTLEGISLQVSSSDSLQTMADRFNAQSDQLDASPQSVAVANQTVANIFAGQRLTYNAYVVQKDDSLASVAALFSTDDSTLINLNLATADVFPAGTALYLSGDDTSYTLQPGDTFSIVASSHNISIDELAARNAAAELLAVNQSATNLVLAIPNLVQFPTSSQSLYYSSYLAKGGSETISGIIGKYADWDQSGFLALNQTLPGLFATAQLPGTQVTPKLTDTILTLAQALGLTPQAFIGQFQGQPNILRPSALVLCPPLQTSSGATLAGMVQTYNLASPLALAQANCALQGLLQSQTLSYTYTPPGGSPISEQYSTGANDTLVTVVAQFNLLFGLTTLTLEDILSQNTSIAFAANQVVLPPPSAAMLPPLTVTLLNSYTDPIFPLTVELHMLRNQQWVDPDFKNDTQVFFNSTPIVASPLAAGSAPLSLTEFATNFEKAFATSMSPFHGFKLGTGEAEDSGGSGKPQLWVVNLDPVRSGISFAVSPQQVSFYALEPLSNQLWQASGVTVPTYTSGQLQWNRTQDFQNVDLDAWLATLLAAIDLVLSPQYAMPAYLLGKSAPQLLTGILTYKQTIAKGLRGLVDYLFTGGSGDLDNAREALYQQALTTLSSVYSTNVLVQFPFTVNSTYQDRLTAPLFSGKAVAQPHVKDGTITNSTLVQHQLQSGDTFVSMANSFGITVIDLVLANKDVANVFTPTSKVTVTVGGSPVTVIADNGDTLATIAGKIYGQPDDQNVSKLAVALWTVDLTGVGGYTLYTNPPAGTQPATLQYIELLPVSSFTTGKLPLSQGQSAVTFLLNIQDPEQRRMAFFDLEYAVNKLEYGIQLPPTGTSSGVAGNYVESSWLTFINPLDAVSFGQVQVPIPLRAFPSLPVLSLQTAAASFPGSPDLVKAKQWNYEFDLDNQIAAQDSMELGAFFNTTGSKAPTPPGQQTAEQNSTEVLNAALAQFMAVQAPIMNDLTLLLSDPTNSAVLPALQAFHDLAKKVSDAWFAPPPADKRIQQDEGELHWYQINTIIDEQVQDQFQFLVLSDNEINPLWPKINDKQYTYQIGPEALYAYNEPISVPLDLRFGFNDLDAISRQNGWSGIQVIRNQNLLGNPDAQTNQAFVYQTPLTLFSNKITPYLLIDALAPLSPGIGADPASQLAQALGAFFTVLFNLDTQPPANSFQIKAQCRYAFILVPATASVSGHTAQALDDDQSIITSLPLVLNPLYPFDPASDANPTNPSSFVSQLAQAALANAETAGVVASDGTTLVPGMYLFDFSVYSSLPSAGAATPSKPILDIRNRYWESPQ